MTSDLCAEEVVVRITAPQIISSETIVPVSVCPGGASGAGGAGGAVGAVGPGPGPGPGPGGSARVAASSAAVELGRRLLLAARAGDTKQVLDLMARGAPFTTDWLGTSALHLAAGGAHVDTCAVLLRAGVSRDARTKVERTPLHLAAAAGHARVAALLLDHGALVDCRDMLRMTPLHWAVERGHAATAAVLVRHGADPAAESKFHKTPLGCARARPDLLSVLEDELREREAADSVHALVNEQMSEERVEPQLRTFETVQRLPAGVKIMKTKQQEKMTRTEQKTEQLERTSRGGVEGEGGETGEGGAPAGGGRAPAGGARAPAGGGRAAALLRAHGITLLPPDDGTTVLSALQSGRTVVLSDAGKLMLKESGSPPPAPPAPAASGPRVAGGGLGAAGVAGAAGSVGSVGPTAGMVLTATPVRSPPRAGVKIFTLNNRLLATNTPASTTKENRIPIRKIIDPTDMQVKFVQLPPDTKLISPSKMTSMKAKSKVSPRPAVKIIMNKSNFHKLMANANANKTNAPHNGVEVAHPGGVGAGMGAGSGGGGSEAEAAGLRAQLAVAQRALAAASAELHACKARLALYEPQPL